MRWWLCIMKSSTKIVQGWNGCIKKEESRKITRLNNSLFEMCHKFPTLQMHIVPAPWLFCPGIYSVTRFPLNCLGQGQLSPRASSFSWREEHFISSVFYLSHC
mmetsp:Transcript_8543/g.12184  ORF Transcript_8543/g.12184 Transcript_8543/m.12184 type:complete len:103 (+) Transcript_8543:1190-1498(+)